MVELQTDGIDVDGVESLLEHPDFRPKLAHIIPNFQNPAGYTLSAEKRARLLALAAEHDFTLFEDDPYIHIRFEGESLPTMLLPGRGGQGRLRLLVLEDRLPRHPRRLPRRPAGRDQADPGDRDEHLHLAEHGRPVDRQRVLPLGAHRRGDPHGQATRCAPAATRSSRRSSASCRRRASPRREGGYFMWVEMPDGFNVAELETAAKERGVVFVKGTDFLMEGGENTLRLAYSGVTPEQIDEGVTRLADAARSLGVAA